MRTDKDSDLKSRTRYSSTFNTELLKELKNLSQETMIPISKLLDKSLELLLKEYDKK
ncbi:ribbon-helix-helix domain-containing protein [Clostridium butyricum]|uniref:Predicted DNA-binding protein ribbon-helix-helix domain-containing protein n=1 Tax=Clostridium butyricum E4 str. BoNT E BL5262 TaxID=632245 RepID=C4IGY2_CLOBU|nr:ribbon-helix-helix domain-containing protein [Clostridium butyricum]EEP53912.1 conserved hypothetical protein [Clostridium butyricum E4 str. BoNT E BL5262]NFL30547.1 ribbon-helix-helix domain-containing protein [Clostridium butyricum]NFS19502.1 ribbon-helix-helix domain-containing protein [Clostridium butyricum]